MIILILVLAILLILLWSKVNEHSRILGERIDLLEKKMAKLVRELEEPRDGSRIPIEPADAEPLPTTEPPVPEEPAPATAPPRLEPKPISHPPASAPFPPLPPKEPVFHPVYRLREWRLPKFDWESIVGVKLFSWVAGVALLLAVVFFLRYSINQGWLMPQVRMTVGILAGIGLLILCEIKAARKYPVTANALDASAIAILFSTFYAAQALWDLIGAVPAFILMVLVTAVAILLSIRRDSVFIALLGLLGGFATPALLSTGENRPISLFTYLLLLNAGLAYVASKKKWPLLTTLSLIFTVFYQWGWVIRFLTESQLPTALGIFLVFPILVFVMAAFGHKEDRGKKWTSLYGQTGNLTALFPLLFTLYIASVPAYGHRYILLFSFLFLLDVGLFVIAMARGPEILHVVGGISTILVSAIWLRASYEPSAWPVTLIFVSLFCIFYLAAPLGAQHFRRSFSEAGRWAVYTAPIILFTFPVLIALEPACADPGLLFGILFLLMLGVSAYAIFPRESAVYFVASLFALLAEALWSFRYLNPEHLYAGLILFCIFGLLYIGVPVLARKLGKDMRPEWIGAGLLLIGIGLLAFLAIGRVAPLGIWGLALLILLLNAGLFWQGSASRLPAFAIIGVALSWIILGMLWASVSLSAILIPALVVVVGFALFVLAGHIWLQKQSPTADLERNGMFLGLVGHLFLAVVAAQSALSIPPWPFLCVLFILDVAIGLSALYLRRNDLHQAAMAASVVILMIWISAARISPWPGVAILSAGALSLFSFVWIYLARRAGMNSSSFSRTAAVTVILSQIAAIMAAAQTGAPGFGFLLATQMVFLLALLGLAWFEGAHNYAFIAVFPTAAAVWLWRIQHGGTEFWPQLLLFAVPIYLVFIAYPYLLGSRSGRSRGPYLAAVMASVPFFFQARDAMLHAGWGNTIGILPLSQALLLGLLVMRLLKIEPRGERTLGRLALVAGAALAFVTVAIPLQLEKEWITIGWALEGVALSWLYGKIPHKGLLYSATGLFTAVFARLALNPFVLNYQMRSGIRIWNWYLYAYLISSAAMIAGGRLLSKTKDELFPGFLPVSKFVPGGGILLLFLLLNIEIADYFSVGPFVTFNFTATLAQDLTYTLAWAAFAVALLATGIAIHSQAARIASLALLVATILKCFIHDLARLGELYRVASFAGLGVCLVLVALALQKYVFPARKQDK